ncbi:MAG: PEP/pyruvate-binding domain-containing protein [Butyricimonas faecihominis]
MPAAYAELNAVQQKLEDYFHDMQDLEFTIQDGKLWMLQTRNGKRTGTAMVKMAVDMLEQGMINEETAILRLEAAKLDELLHPVFDKESQSKAKVLTKGLPASPGAACGRVVALLTRRKNGKQRRASSISSFGNFSRRFTRNERFRRYPHRTRGYDLSRSCCCPRYG